MADLIPVEIFATGHWGGLDWTEADLDQMVANYARLQDAIKPPVKLGHDDKQILAQTDGQPALGWVAGLRRMGSKLIADIADMPTFLREALRKGAYRRVSSEIYPAFEATTAEKNLHSGVIGNVLSAVAVLGADAPEVKTLQDLPRVLATAQHGQQGSVGGLTGTLATLAAATVNLDTRWFSADETPVSLIAKRDDVNPKTGETAYGNVSYADPVNKKYPIDTEAHIRAAWSYIHQDKNAAKYDPKDVAAIKGRIIAAWKKTISADGPSAAMTVSSEIYPTFEATMTEYPRITKTEGTDSMDEKAIEAMQAELTQLRAAKEHDDKNAAVKMAVQSTELAALRVQAEKLTLAQQAAELRAQKAEAVQFVESRQKADNLKLSQAQAKLAETLYVALSETAIVVPIAEAQTLKLFAETETAHDLSARELFVRFVDATPNLKINLTVTSAQTQSADMPATFSEAMERIAKRDTLDMKTNDGRIAAARIAAKEYPDLRYSPIKKSA